jgi:acid phosphatase (class A)
MGRSIRAIVALVGATTLATQPLAAQTAETIRVSYLHNGQIGYVPPAPPEKGSSQDRNDLDAVRAAQNVDEARRREAFEDAGAYDYDQLLPRFSQAAGTELTLHSRPILAHMLNRLLGDTQNYAGTAKTRNPRDRPYVEDPTIVPCETDFLYPSNAASYPSGHATNGFAAALLIAEVMSGPRTNRGAIIMARGIRYGDNRVVCGVHHPSDVEAGRILAREVYRAVHDNLDFKADLDCAKIEDARSAAGLTGSAPPQYSRECQRSRATYLKEAGDRAAKRVKEAGAFGSP